MIATMQAEDIRRLKEDFVSNLHGTTKWEIFCVVSCMPLCLLIAAYAESWVHARSRASGKALLKLQRIPKFCYEFAIVVVPQVLLLMSVAPAEPAFLLLFLLWGSLALKLWMKLAHSPGSRQHMLHLLNHISTPRKRYVSVFRGGLMLITCLSILAVDFQAFPRRYAKAESSGAGVMDVGVGAIVWAGGLVSAAAAAAAAAAADAGLDSSSMQAVSGSSSKDNSKAGLVSSYLWRLGKGLRAAVPLVLLGGVRLLATAAVGYQQHLGEYGLHWNFFWTIAAVSVATLVVPVPPGWLALAGLLVTVLHQAVLSLNLGLTAGGTLSDLIPAVLSEQQRAAAGFWVANKEGLASLPGYWALYLLGAAVGQYLATSCAAAVSRARSRLLPHSVSGSSSRMFGGGSVSGCAREIWAWVGWCLLLDLCVWGLLLAAETWVEPVSRRSCNLAYVLWTTAQCLAWLLLCLITDMLTTGLSGSSSSAPSTLLSSRMKQTPSAAAAGPTTAAGGAAAAAAGGVGPPSNLASGAAGQPTAAALRTRGGRRRSSGSTSAAVAAALGAAAAAVACGADQVAAAVPVQQCSSAPDSPVAAQRHHGAAAAAAAPQSAAAVHGAGAAAIHGVAAAAAAVHGSPNGSVSSGASSSPERQRRNTPKQPPQQLLNPNSVNNASGKPMQDSMSGITSNGPMRLMLAFNRNMLSLFLLANLLTGVVNLGLNTLAVSSWTARTIVGVYMLVLCGAAVMLDAAGVTLKAW